MNSQSDLMAPVASSARAAMLDAYGRMMRAAPEKTSRFLNVQGGRRVHLLEAGEGPSLLHLHGSSTSSHSQSALLDRLPMRG